MSALEPFDRELLDFLCACAHHRVRVVRVKAPRIASLRRLRFAGLVGFDDHLPSPSALQGWIERQQIKSEAETALPADDEPPAPTAAAEGGGDVRKTTSPPNPKHKVSSRQREETPRSVGCDEGTSGGKKPIPDEAGPTQVEPAPIVAPLARARPAAPKVDIKVNERRDPTQRPETPEMDGAERERIKGARMAQAYKRRVRTRAQNLIDAGQQGGSKGRNYEVRGAMKELQENADAQARFLDPVEQAKTVIRQGGWNCFAATVRDGPADHYYIGTRVVPEAELLAFAERLRTTRARRAG